MSGELNLELLNGNWGIASASLMVICFAYLWHETSARETLRRASLRRRKDATRFTRGMRVAVAVFTMSLGIFIRSLETWRWRAMGADISELSQTWLTIGGIIAVVGLLCAIREISGPLFGKGPWVWTLIVMVLFNVVTLMIRFW